MSEPQRRTARIMNKRGLGTDVELCAEGPDSAAALTAIAALIEAKFGEE